MTVAAACAQEDRQAGLFPFVIPWDDDAAGVANLAAWNKTPAGRDGFIAVRDGHFVDGSGARIRFLGTNTTFASNFPPHEVADKVARRMAKFGINIVRFHHMDNQVFPNGIWDPASPAKTRLSDEALDRLDYFISQLKANGIYADLNLHVSRTLGAAEGIEGPGNWPDMNKGADNVHPRMIELQRHYAHDLLTHVNPYTGNAYVDEPGVAVIEINNENSFVSQWAWGAVDDWPEALQQLLDERWNTWLSDKYMDTQALQTFWSEGAMPLGDELLTNGDFAAGADKWNVELHEGCQATATRTDDGPEGTPALRLDIAAVSGPGWYVQLHQSPIAFEADQPYRLTFWAKADPPRRISVNNFTAHEPWGSVGFATSVELTPEWRQFSFGFRANATDPNCRIGFGDFATATGQVWFAGVSLRPGGVEGLPEGASLLHGDIPRPRHDGMGSITPAEAKDYVAFLLALETQYWTGMARYLKDDLGVKCPVTGTQMGYTPIDTHRAMDYYDGHAYWQHPWFPTRPWDGYDWWVGNTSMVTGRGGTLPGLATQRPAGAPYTVSEYNHPAPNQYSSEAFLLSAAYGAFQDWDGLFQFDYNGGAKWDDEMIPGFFDLKAHPTQLVTMPVAAALLRRRDVAAAREVIRVSTTAGSILEKGQSNPAAGSDATSYGVPREAALVHRTEVVQGADAVRTEGPTFTRPADDRFVSDTGELTWDAYGRVVTADTPRCKFVVGFADDASFNLSGVGIRVGRTRLNWAAITATVMEGDSFTGPARLLITATGDAQNTGWGWETNGENATVHNNWGRPPSLVEGIPGEITLPVPAARVQAWALDPQGQRAAEVAVTETEGHAVLAIGPQHQTLWYEVAVQ